VPLSLRVQSFHDSEVSWDELRDLASSFLTRNHPLSLSFSATTHSLIETISAYQSNPPSPEEKRSFLTPIVPLSSAKPPPPNGQWQDRVVHNYLVDSTDKYPNLMSHQPPPLHRTESPHSSPQYPLSLPKVPPPGMTSQQACDFLFHVVDHNGSGIVSKDELINTLQQHPELAQVPLLFSICLVVSFIHLPL
jgi:hypothetical protein